MQINPHRQKSRGFWEEKREREAHRGRIPEAREALAQEQWVSLC
jgi:hypothetical protein